MFYVWQFRSPNGKFLKAIIGFLVSHFYQIAYAGKLANGTKER